MAVKLNISQRLSGATVEGLYSLTALLLRLVESTLLLTAFTANSAEMYTAAVVAAVAYSLLLAPVRLGRQMWYCHLLNNPEATPSVILLWKGWLRWRWAVSWRWMRWLRLTGWLLLATLPTALLWGYGSWRSLLGEPTQSLLGLVLGGVALLGGLVAVGLRRCRYAPVPVLLAAGYTTPMALVLSRQFTRRRTGEWVQFWGSQAGRLALCLLPGGMLWVLPPLRLEYTALLTRWINDGFTREGNTNTCIFRGVPL